MSPGDLAGEMYVIVGYVRIRIATAMFQFDGEADAELLQRNMVKWYTDLVADVSCLLLGKCPSHSSIPFFYTAASCSKVRRSK